jgi:hypothetical protein
MDYQNILKIFSQDLDMFLLQGEITLSRINLVDSWYLVRGSIIGVGLDSSHKTQIKFSRSVYYCSTEKVKKMVRLFYVQSQLYSLFKKILDDLLQKEISSS